MCVDLRDDVGGADWLTDAHAVLPAREKTGYSRPYGRLLTRSVWSNLHEFTIELS